ncbi:IS66 family insertion sequence element accessory protein TnpB, partial [Agrobacterium vitis]
DGQGFCLFYKILERGYFPWPTAKEGVAHLTQAQCWFPRGTEPVRRIISIEN